MKGVDIVSELGMSNVSNIIKEYKLANGQFKSSNEEYRLTGLVDKEKKEQKSIAEISKEIGVSKNRLNKCLRYVKIYNDYLKKDNTSCWMLMGKSTVILPHIFP